MVKWGPKWAIGGLLKAFGQPSYLTHLVGPLGQPGTPWRVAGQRWLSQTQKKKKKNLFLSQSSKTCPGNILEAATADQSSQVKSNLDPWIVSACKFGGNKIRNHILYLTPLIALKISKKEGAAVDTVFCPTSICVLDLEKSKNIIFSPWGHKNI